MRLGRRRTERADAWIKPSAKVLDEHQVAAAAVLLKKIANLAKGSAEPNRNKVGTVTARQVEDIAKQKLPDLNTQDLASAIKTVRGTARSMGIDVVG